MMCTSLHLSLTTKGPTMSTTPPPCYAHNVYIPLCQQCNPTGSKLGPVHYTDSPDGAWRLSARCGLNVSGYPVERITHDPKAATCKSCIRAARALGEL